MLNRAIEWSRRQRPEIRALRDRAVRLRDRRPLIVVPSILGTQITVGDRVLWGSVRRLYFGPPVTAPSAVASGLLDGFTVVPGLYRYDVFGGLLRFLERVGGYQRERDLFVLPYDWRQSVTDAAERLADLVARVPGGRVDLIAISTGGLVVRHYLADAAARAGRVIYVGTPQRGSFQAVSTLHEGVQMVPLGRRFSPSELAACKTCWDALPHPDDPLFIDEAGDPLEVSLYDPATWHRVKLGVPPAEIGAHLERAQALHRRLDAAVPHTDSVVIGARHLPTLSRMPIIRGRAVLPACTPKRGDPLAPRLFEPGDSSLAARSLEALPGLDPRRVRTVTPAEHRMLPADHDVHRWSLDALLGAHDVHDEPGWPR